MKDKKIRTCKICNKPFKCKNSLQKYCSRECYNNNKSIRNRELELKEILKNRKDLNKIILKDNSYRLKQYIVKVGFNEKSTWTIERDFYFFKTCKFDKSNENLYYIHDFNDDKDFSASLIKYTDTSLSEKEFEYYRNKGNLVFYEKLH